MPWLAMLICASAFDLALHDAYGNLLGRPVYDLYGPEHLSRDLSSFLEAVPGSGVDFRGRHPVDFLKPRQEQLRAWHLVGGLDPIAKEDLRGDEPRDGHPILLEDWIRRDGLTCLKIKLRGNDPAWDYARLVGVGELAVPRGVEWLTADFNCTVREPDYVNEILDRLRDEHPRLYGMLLYVEQPFAYELDSHRVDVRSVSARKPLFLDESAHDWRVVRLGRELGWTGVALKTCKTQSGALLSLCWARAHGMTLMVQDLTNPMLAQLPHLQLAAHAGTIMGVETNGMQFYPAVSEPEEHVHPGCYRRRGGRVDLCTVRGSGFGYRLAEIARELPAPVVEVEGG
jgi:L-alanine-DL-glutamate epimerase-like enolase superfamily enzyme